MPIPAPRTRSITRGNQPRAASSKAKAHYPSPTNKALVHGSGSGNKSTTASTVRKNVQSGRRQRTHIVVSDDELDASVVPLHSACPAASKSSRRIPTHHTRHPVSPPVTSDMERNEEDPPEDATGSGDELPEHLQDNDNNNGKMGSKRKRSGRGKKEKSRKKQLCDYETDTEKREYIEDVCRALGRYFPRAIDPWVDVDNVIWVGLRLADEANKQNVYVEQMKPTTRNEYSWSILLELLQRDITFPQIFSVYKTDQIGVKAVIHEMHEGAKEARATDTNKVWREILTLILEDPRTNTVTMPKPIAKTSYGFNYVDTGRLLCPQIYLSDFNANPRFLQKLADGKVEVTASYWPSFLYCQKLHKPNDIESGLMKGYLLLRVFQHIFCSTGDPTKQGGTKRRNVAKINRMHKITGRHIAYAACQTRYALCAKDSWTERDGAFDMDAFYIAIIDLFEEYPDDEWATATLAWWNEQVFGDAEGRVITTAEKQTHPPDSSVAQMAAARAARAKARAEAAAVAADTNAEHEHETDDM